MCFGHAHTVSDIDWREEVGFLAEKSPFFRNFASHILPVLTFATLLVGTALVGVALTRIPQRPTDAAPPSPTPETTYIAAGSLTGRTILVDRGPGGYAGGATPNPTYREVCSGQTGHNEVVKVVYDPAQVSFERLLQVFWESHDPTQGMRQGNDVGTQYRSGIYCHTPEQQAAAEASRDAYQQTLRASGYGDITTEIIYPPPAFYYAEDYHQQYLAKNPNGYCGLGGTGVSCPVGLGV